MAWFLFIDESGHDRGASPYEVLAGISIKDTALWPMVNELHAAEVACFGRRYSQDERELKGKKILKAKVFHHVGLNVAVAAQDVPRLAREALDAGGLATVAHLKALAIAKLDYVRRAFEICARHGCRAFASIVEIDSPRTATDGLRKDYAYLFERFFYFLEDQPSQPQGIIVFDELEKSQSHILTEQAYRYFSETAIGRQRARLVVPEPFFVHSDLTTGIQIADLIAYCLSWGFRTPRMLAPARSELKEFADQISALRYRAVRNRQGIPNFEIWSFAHIFDLRTRNERDLE